MQFPMRNLIRNYDWFIYSLIRHDFTHACIELMVKQKFFWSKVNSIGISERQTSSIRSSRSWVLIPNQIQPMNSTTKYFHVDQLYGAWPSQDFRRVAVSRVRRLYTSKICVTYANRSATTVHYWPAIHSPGIDISAVIDNQSSLVSSDVRW